MSVSKIDKIQILSHARYQGDMLDLLYDSGVLEIIKVESKEDGVENKLPATHVQTLQKLEYDSAKIKHALDVLSGYRENKLSFFEKLNFQKPNYTKAEINKLKAKFNYNVATEMVAVFSQDINSFKSLIAKLQEDIKFLTPWKNLKIITAYDRNTEKTFALTGTMDPREYSEMMLDKEKMPECVEIVDLRAVEREKYLLVVAHKNDEKKITKILDTYNFKKVDLPRLDIEVEEKIKRLKKEINTTRNRITNVEERLKSEANRHYAQLEIMSDYIRWELDQASVKENLLHTTSTFSVTGWVQNSKKKNLIEKIEKITNEFSIIDLEIEEDDDVPVVMENNKFIQPFEFVTNIYGYPKYTEIDPTPFLAGFFIIFFGLNLTDAGYGITVSLISILALRFLNLSKEFKKLLKVLFVGGIITFIAGALTGGWFGVELEKLPASMAWLVKPLLSIRQIDMINEPMTMLVFSIILGYIHLFFGHFIDLWWKTKHGRFLDGLRDSGVWMFFLLVTGLWIVGSQGIALTGSAKISLYLVYFSIALIIFTQGTSKNFIVKIFGGLGALYFGLSGYISDILSYSRLLALGLATGIIGMVINIVGSMVIEMVPYVGWILAIFVLIGGHLLNLVISLVGAFIHAGRLQYVEFFKRFFDGGGRAFRPFVRQSVYVELDNEVQDK